MGGYRWVGVLLLTVGLGFVGFTIWSVIDALDLVDEGVRTTTVHRTKSKYGWTGHIEVGGQRYGCRGTSRIGQEVVYDPADPARCRPVEALGGFDNEEQVGLAAGVGFGVVGVALWILEHLGRGREEEEIALLLRGRASTTGDRGGPPPGDP